MRLQDLLPAVGVYRIHGSDQKEILHLSSDSREVVPGSLFVALSGARVDGHQYLQAAADRGAVALVVEWGRSLSSPEGVTLIEVRDTRRALAILADRFYGSPSRKLSVVGVTGTNGKTTTTSLIATILRSAGHETGVIGTIETVIGERRLPAKNTTPESIELQRILKEMVDRGLSHCVMEVSSHALAMGRVRGISFAQALFTNLTQDHLDYHGSMEEYARAKGLLFSQLGNIYSESLRPAILNADDPHSAGFARVTAQPVITYGIENEADVMATDISMDENGIRFTLRTWNGGKFMAHISLIGRFNLYNSLAALTSAYLLGIPFEQGIEAIRTITGVSGRFEKVEEGQDFTVIVDYAHTPDGLENVLSTVRQLAKRRVFCVVGAGGERDRGKRPKMARVAERYADFLFLTSDNPRREDPAAILQEMKTGLIHDTHCKTEVISDRKEAITRAIALAEPGDIVLIAGKGHETYQILGTDVIHFDDREVAGEAIRRLYHA